MGSPPPPPPRIVSKKKAALARKRMSKKSGIGAWLGAVKKARAELNLTGFVACKKGTEFYTLTKSHYDATN